MICPPKVCVISRRDLRVGIYSDSQATLDACRKGSFVRYVPDYGCVDYDLGTLPDDYAIWHYQNHPRVVQQQLERRRIVLGGDIADFVCGETIPYLAYSLLERAGMARGEATLHGASVTRNGNGILILGKSGSGKTSLALNLCRRYGCSIMANDLTVIRHQNSNMYLVAGTREFYVRESNIRRYQPELVAFLEQNAEDPWWSRSTLYPDELGITVEREVVPICRVLMVHVSADGGKVIESPINKRWARIYLYEAISRYILRSRLPVLAGEEDKHWIFMPSMDSEELYGQRVAIVNCIIDTMKYYTVTGGLNEVSDYIHNELL